MDRKVGRASLKFERPPVIESSASVVGKKEGEGPLGSSFDKIEEDGMCGKKTWEEAESFMQQQACILALEKGKLKKEEIRYLFAGDLLGQLIATSFGAGNLEIPLFGLYGACSTIGEALCLSAMTVAGGFADRVLAVASSHFATAEKQFRFPLGYGNQRPFSSTWTVTGSGAFVVSDPERAKKGLAKITAITTGKATDIGAKDSMNMGAAMAPAAYSTIARHFMDFETDEKAFDRIITGELGEVGRTVLLDFMKEDGHDLSQVHMDCGMEIFDKESQDTHAGGSGCGCAASTLSAYVLRKVVTGEWKKILFVPTGALLSTVSFNEGQTIPSIAHGVVIEHME